MVRVCAAVAAWPPIVSVMSTVPACTFSNGLAKPYWTSVDVAWVDSSMNPKAG